MLSDSGARELRGITDRAVRHGFIRKVYAIVGSQLLLTFAIALGIMQIGEERLRANQSLTLGLLLVSAALSILMLCIFCCAPQLMRNYPINYCILFLFTVGESICVGLISVQYTTASVVMAFGITCVIVVGLTIFACQTKYDFTSCGPYLFVAALCLMLFGFFVWLGSFFLVGEAFKTLNLVYACGGALLMSCYIVFDTQLIVGGKHQRAHEFLLDDYAFAAICLYLDIVRLFLYILEIFGNRR